MLKKTISLLLTLCLLLTAVPMAQTTAECEHVWTYSQMTTGTTKHHLRTCSLCGKNEKEACDITTATCTEPSVCTKCGYQFAEATGHDQSGALSRAAATCTAPETTYVACSKCGTNQVFSTSGKALGHNYVKKTDPATCLTAERHYEECTRCFDVINESTVGEPLGHNYVETGRVAATCIAEGSVTYTCDNDGCTESYTDTLAMIDHNYAESARVEPTCFAEGSVTYSCQTEGCTESYSEPLAMIDHNYAESARVEPTCTTDGSVTYSCQNDGCTDSYTEPLAAIGHSYKKTKGKTATCTEEGYGVYTCQNCGDSYTKTWVLGHSFTTQDGITFTCERCGYVEVDEEAKAKAEAEVTATPIPSAFGNVDENGNVTDLTLTSAIQEVGGGYSLRREEATLNSIALAAERDPENCWMRLTATEAAKQLGMVSGFIGDNMTLELTENDEVLKITGVSMEDSVLTVTTSSGATFELSTPGVALGYTELESISEKDLDRIVFKRMGNVLMIDFASAAALEAEVQAALATPTPAPRSIYEVEITFSLRTITREATPTPVPVPIETEEECMIVIIAYDDEEEVEEYERSACTHRWVYAEENTCRAARTCELCGKHEDTPSEHCWYCWKKVVNGKSYDMDTQITNSEGEILYDYVVSTYILKCRYCDATMEESSLNQVVGKCTHPRLKESYTLYDSNGTDNQVYSWCTMAMSCPDCQSKIAAVGHNWKITGEDGDYYTAVCQRCGKTVKANKKYYNSSKDKLDTSEMSCVDDSNNHAWVTVDSDGCKKTLVCSNCGTQTTMDHDWKVTRQNMCNFTAVCQNCGKTEKVTIHRKIEATSVSKGTVTKAHEPGNEYERIQTYAYCSVCGKTLASETIDLLSKSNTSIQDGKITKTDNEKLSEYKHSDKETELMEKLMKKLGVKEFPTINTLPVYLTDGYINSQSQ
jgi:hypothetical protein